APQVRQTSDNNYLLYGAFDYYGSKRTGSLVKIDAHGDAVEGFKPLSSKYLIRDLEILPDNKILIVTGDAAYGASLLRLNADGSIDDSFTPPNNFEYVSFGVQSTGRIIVVTYNGQPGSYSLKRLNANGTLDNTFNPNTTVNFPTNIAIAPDDRIYV